MMGSTAVARPDTRAARRSLSVVSDGSFRTSHQEGLQVEIQGTGISPWSEERLAMGMPRVGGLRAAGFSPTMAPPPGT